MAITPNKAAIEAAGLEYVEPHEIVADTGPKALNLLAQAVVDLMGKSGGSGGFPVQAITATGPTSINPDALGWPRDQVVTLVVTQGANAHAVTNDSGVLLAEGAEFVIGGANTESMAVYRYSAGLFKWVCEGAWVSAGGVTVPVGKPVTAAAPTADDSTDTYTIPNTTGVEYMVAGAVKAPGTYAVGDVETSVTVTARATAGYELMGTSLWTFSFTKAPKPAMTPEAAALSLQPLYYLPLDDAVGSATVSNRGSRGGVFNVGATCALGAASLGGRGTSATFTDASGASSSIPHPDTDNFANRGSMWDTPLAEMTLSIRVDIGDSPKDGKLWLVGSVLSNGSPVLLTSGEQKAGNLYVWGASNSFVTVGKLPAGPHTLTTVADSSGLKVYLDGVMVNGGATWKQDQTGFGSYKLSIGPGTGVGFRASDFIMTAQKATPEQVAELHRSYGAA